MLSAQELEKQWTTDTRWTGIKRNYSAADVVKLAGTLTIQHTLAEHGARYATSKSWTKSDLLIWLASGS
jgi:isocitrate lyase